MVRGVSLAGVVIWHSGGGVGGTFGVSRRKWVHQGSNLGPSDYESDALTD